MPYIPNTVISAAGAAASQSDPIFDLFGTPDTAFEFDTSSLSGLTALSPTPDVVNADTSIPGYYYIQDDAASLAFCGHYASAPSPPWTAISFMSSNSRASGQNAHIFQGVAVPGAFEVVGIGFSAGNVSAVSSWNSPTSFGATIAFFTEYHQIPLYLAIRVNTATSVDYLVSNDGLVWAALVAARNPGFTIATVGMGIAANNGGLTAAGYDFLRIWDSALTFPGAL